MSIRTPAYEELRAENAELRARLSACHHVREELQAELEALRPTVESYRSYLQSPEWQIKRQDALDRARRRCQVCNTRSGLQVHHRTYERLGEELPEDLTVLCEGCHEAFHRTRGLWKDEG